MSLAAMPCRLLLGSLIPILLLCTARAVSQDWPMLNGNAARTSHCLTDAPQPPLRPALPSLLPVGGAQACSYAGGILYVASHGEPNTLTAVDAATGTALWTFDVPGTRGSMGHIPAVTDDLVLCSGQKATALYALHRQDGTIAWSVSMGAGYARSAVYDGSRAFIVTDSLYCIDFGSGAVLWTFAFDAPTTPSLDADAVYAVGNYELIAVEKLTGREIWRIPTNHAYHGHVIAADDALYVSDWRSIRAVSKSDGSEIWSTPLTEVETLSQLITGCMALGGDVLCVAVWRDTTTNGELLALDRRSGDRLWTQRFGSEGVFTPVIIGNTVYATDFIGEALWGFDLSDGGLRCTHEEAKFTGQPIPAGGKLYVPSRNGIFVFEEETVGSVSHTPPAAAIDIVLSPNPARDAVSVTLTLRERSPLRLSVHDLLGRNVAVITDAVHDAGTHVFRWDAASGSFPAAPAGMYLVTARAGDMLRTERLLLY